MHNRERPVTGARTGRDVQTHQWESRLDNPVIGRKAYSAGWVGGTVNPYRKGSNPLYAT